MFTFTSEFVPPALTDYLGASASSFGPSSTIIGCDCLSGFYFVSGPSLIDTFYVNDYGYVLFSNVGSGSKFTPDISAFNLAIISAAGSTAGFSYFFSTLAFSGYWVILFNDY